MSSVDVTMEDTKAEEDAKASFGTGFTNYTLKQLNNTKNRLKKVRQSLPIFKGN